MKKLINLLSTEYDPDNWPDQSKEAFEDLFGAENGRYPQGARKEVQLRCPSTEVPFSAIIHASNPNKGGYGGTSFVIFPSENGFILGMGLGTQGLSPDEHIVSKPGHNRKINSICEWLNSQYSNDLDSGLIAWSKQDPTRIDKSVPNHIRKLFPSFQGVFKKYGNELYGFCFITSENIEKALKAFLDFYFSERGFKPLTSYINDAERIKDEYFNHLLPEPDVNEITRLVNEQKYLILQGPPGTGKTMIANQIFENHFNNNGKKIQFHPNTTYENFIGGLFPDTSTDKNLGLNFTVRKGQLLKAVKEANLDKETDYLFLIDEINRADLSKVLGEAIYCFEPGEERSIDLDYDFGEPIGSQLKIPKNLKVIGTMNNSDKSIASFDLAIRRRFSFFDINPQFNPIKKQDDDIANEAFQDLLSIFTDYATDEIFSLMPGHSYFINKSDLSTAQFLKTNLIPLLNDYISQGYLGGFEDEIHGYVQKIKSLPNSSN